MKKKMFFVVVEKTTRDDRLVIWRAAGRTTAGEKGKKMAIETEEKGKRKKK